MNISFIGAGNVGAPLADHLAAAGHSVTLAARDPQSKSIQAALARNPALAVLPAADAVRGADVVFLATPFGANADALAGLDSALAGKVLVDCTNPVGPGLTHGLGGERSGSEFVQGLVPSARVVKAFTIYGYENFIDNGYPGAGEPPCMLICGDDAAAKEIVAGFCRELGWKPVDAGPLSSALHLEHMTLLWIKMARMGGKGPNFVWAILER